MPDINIASWGRGGVGGRKSGLAAALNIHCSIKSGRRLLECVNTLVE